MDEELQRARRLAAAGEDEAARAAYLDVLREDPTHLEALNELGNLAFSGGFRAAACSAYRQAILHHPEQPELRVNLGNALAAAQDVAGAMAQYRAALSLDARCAGAHRGIAFLIQDEDPDQAEQHLSQAFAGGALIAQPYRGRQVPVPLLLLVSARGGNLAVQSWISERDFAISALYLEYWCDSQVPPPHALIVNAIGDADRCPLALARAAALVARATVPVINAPARVAHTGRIDSARRLAKIADVVAPETRQLTPQELRALPASAYPLLLRRPGFHTGQHFLKVDAAEDLPAAQSSLGEGALLAIQYLDARGPDRLARKYRVMFVDGVAYPVHLAIAADWKVHYFTAGMGQSSAYREEERRFLLDMRAVLGARAVAALERIRETLGLDYAGVDFGLAPDGRLLLFEANATMVVAIPEADPKWDYRRPALEAVHTAARAMVLNRVRSAGPARGA